MSPEIVVLVMLIAELIAAPFCAAWQEAAQHRVKNPPPVEYTVEIPDEYRDKLHLKIKSDGVPSSGELISEYLDTHTIAGLTPDEWKQILDRNAALDEAATRTGISRDNLNAYTTKEG